MHAAAARVNAAARSWAASASPLPRTGTGDVRADPRSAEFRNGRERCPRREAKAPSHAADYRQFNMIGSCPTGSHVRMPLKPPPLVSILIPGYNPEFFGIALASAIAQTFDRIERCLQEQVSNRRSQLGNDRVLRTRDSSCYQQLPPSSLNLACFQKSSQSAISRSMSGAN